MNLKQKLNKVAGRTPEIVLIVLVLLAGFGAISYVTDNTDPVDNQSEQPENQTNVNVSDHLDNKTQTCDSPEINQSNASQLKACVSNQTLSD